MTATVRDGFELDLDRQDVKTSLFANWDDFADPEGYPVVYEWAIGSIPGGTDVMEWRRVGGATRASTDGVALPTGATLYVSVRSTDILGSRSEVGTSDGIVLGPPPAGDPSASPPDSPAAPAAERAVEKPLQTPVGGPALVSSVERFGITWAFSRPTPSGRFVNGDWWVVGPVEIVSITPPSSDENGRVRNGSMVDPDPKALHQGYDNAMFGPDSAGRFDLATNVALGISAARPLRLEPGSTLVSTISHPEAGQLPQLTHCSVLTCLFQPPPADAFRPPYCGTDKRCRWLASKLDLTQLARLQAPPDAPPLRDLAAHFERTWLDHVGGWTGRFLHPSSNMPDYGRDIADLVGLGALALQLDVRDEEKRALAIPMVQLGIDLFGIVENGGRFVADGASGAGRKFPVLLAGALLQDKDLLHAARQRKFAFAEDVQTFYVEQTSPGVWNRGYGDYGPEDEGLPEWSGRHADDPSGDRRSWTSDPYRRCCTANVWHGFVLAARIMGLKDAWGHNALFDYVDRYMQTEPPGVWTRSWSPFAERMWDRHRAAH